MKKLLILTGVILTLIVIYPKKSWEIFRKIENIVSSHFYADTVTSDHLVERSGLYYKKHTNIPFSGNNQTYFKDGQVRSKEYFKDGKLDGLYELYYHNGQLEYEGYYKAGKKEGFYKRYWDSGLLWKKGSYKAGEKEGLYERYWDSGLLWKKGSYKAGNKEGIWKFFNKDGTANKEPTGIYRNGLKVSD